MVAREGFRYAALLQQRHTKYGRIRGMVVGEGGRSTGVLLYNESVHRKKQHTRGNNTIPYKLATLMTFETLKWKYTFAPNVLIVTRDESPLVYRAPESASDTRNRVISGHVISGQAQFWPAPLQYFKLL